MDTTTKRNPDRRAEADALAAQGLICPGFECPGCVHCDIAPKAFGFDGPSVDSRAGGVTSNQYGTFANHDASEAQLRLIARLRAAKGVAAPADERLTKKAASRLIDKLMELADSTANVAPALPATEVEAWLAGLGRKVEVDEVTPELTSSATEWAKGYQGDFEYMVSMRDASRRGPLSTAQAKGVLNCWRADLCRRAARTQGAAVARVTEDGMYRNPTNGEIYKVQVAKQGSGNLYAKLMVELDEPVVMKTKTKTHEFEYVPGLINRIDPSWKMTLDEAREWGCLYGTCCNCGAALTDERSIERGIGPICESKF